VATGTYGAAGINLTEWDFWSRPLHERHEAFRTLRHLAAPAFFAEPDNRPVAPMGAGYYAIVTHADVIEASRRPQDFCSGGGATSITDMPADLNEYFGSMINMDDPRHAKIRRIVSRAFSPRRVQRFEDQVQEVAGQVVDEVVAKGSGDFVEDVAARLPLKIICGMMGIPESAYRTVFDNSNVILAGADPEFMPGDTEQAAIRLLTAGQTLKDLVEDLGRHRRDNPTDDLISALVNANIDGESLTDQELGSFFILLVVAGNETTRNAIAHGLTLFTTNPDQRGLLMDDLEGRLPGAVEEIVRYASPVVWMRRTATRDTELNGNEFHAGDKLLLYYWSANRDETVFTDPETFDIARSPNPHVGFGGPGPHFCLGSHLARREIGVMYRELFLRVPRIRASAAPDRLLSSFINGIKRLSYEI
jgi:methyl-branched lipid omega-hydroxylase